MLYGHHASRYHFPRADNCHLGYGIGSLFRNAFSRHFPKFKHFVKTRALPEAKKIAEGAVRLAAPVAKEVGKVAISTAIDAAGQKAGELITKASEAATVRGVPDSIVEAAEEAGKKGVEEVLLGGKRKLLNSLDEVTSSKKLNSRLAAASSSHE